MKEPRPRIRLAHHGGGVCVAETTVGSAWRREPCACWTGQAAMPWFGRRSLTLLSSALSVCGLALLGVAVSTDYWLFSEETFAPLANRSVWLHVAVHSGLWRVCSLEGEEQGRCSRIGYFSPSKTHFTSDSTASVLRLIRSATPFPLASLLLMLVGFVLSSVGHVQPQRTALAFVSGICFILSGLALVVGLVLYISSVNDEVVNMSSENATSFTYRYGWSFTFAAISFFFTEGAGVVSVYLFMKRYGLPDEFQPQRSTYRARLSNCSDFSGQFLHPDVASPSGAISWGVDRRTSDQSSDNSVVCLYTLPWSAALNSSPGSKRSA
uniref:Calcium channel, voltage-dependent, gamma subunit 5b n=1 Tax=Eptatretus burgeri TaxID=7764 RepID=A0A8C4X0I3_EPTBU